MTALVGTVVVSPRWQAGMTYTAKGKYTLVGAIVTADTITFPSILPALSNAVLVTRVRLYGQEFDTNASPTATVIIGDGTTTNAYLTSKVAGNALTQFQMDGDGANIGTTITVSRDMVVTVGGTIATAAATGDVWLEVDYYCAGK